MTIAKGLYEVTNESYLNLRYEQSRYLATGFAKNNLPTILPPGPHAVYLDLNRMFPERRWQDFAGKLIDNFFH